MKQLTTILLGLMVMVIMGCSSKKVYQVQLSNSTKYDFDGIEIQMGDESQRIALNSMEKSKVIEVSYTTSWANLFGSGSLGLWTQCYSLNGVTIDHPYGNMIIRDDLDKQLINHIVVREIRDEEGEVRFRYILQ